MKKMKKLKVRQGFKEEFERALKKIDDALKETPSK